MSQPDDEMLPRRDDLPETDTSLRTCLLIGLGVMVVFSTIIAGLGYYFYSVMLQPLDVARTPETAEERRVVLQQSLDPAVATLLSVDEKTRREIVALIDQLNDVEMVENGPRLLALIDVETCFQRAVDSGFLNGMRPIERQTIREQFEMLLTGPLNGGEGQVTSIELRPDGLAAEVTGLFTCRFNVGEPFRFWLEKDRGTWRFVDWMEVNVGYSESQLVGSQLVSTDGAINDVFTELNSAHRAMENYEFETAKSDLRNAEKVVGTMDPAIADVARYYIAGAWIDVYDFGEAVRVASAITNPDLVPGADYILANAKQNQGDPRGALEHCTAYRTRVGGPPLVLSLEARSLRALNRTDEARKLSLQAWLLLPTSETLGRDCLDGHHDIDIEQLLEAAHRRDAVAKAVPQWIRLLSQSQRFHDLRVLQEKLLSIPHAPKLREWIEREVAWGDGNSERCAELCLKALLAGEDDEDDALLNRYLEAMLEMRRPVEAVQKVPDKLKAFQILTGDHWKIDLPFWNETMLALLMELKADYFRHPDVRIVAGNYYYQIGDLRNSSQFFQELLAEFQTDSSGKTRQREFNDEEAERICNDARMGLARLPYRFLTAKSFRTLHIERPWESRQLALRLLNARRSRFDELVKNWEEHSGRDLFIAEMEIHRAIAEDDFEGAYRLCQEEFETIQEDDNYQFATFVAPLWLNVAERTGKLDETARQLVSRQELYLSLFYSVPSRTQFDALIQVADPQVIAQSPDAVYGVVLALHRRHQYSQLIEWMERIPEDMIGEWDMEQTDELGGYYFRALMQSGRTREAAELADRNAKKFEDPSWRLRAAIARGDMSPILADLNSFRDAFLEHVYQDSICQPILAMPAMKPLQEVCPLQLSSRYFAPSIISIPREPIRTRGAVFDILEPNLLELLNERVLREVLNRELPGQVLVESLRPDLETNTFKFLLTYSRTRFIVSFSEGWLWRFNYIHEGEVWQRFAENQFQIAIAAIDSDVNDPQVTQHLVRTLIRALCLSDLTKLEKTVVYDGPTELLLLGDSFVGSLPDSASRPVRLSPAEGPVQVRFIDTPWMLSPLVTQRVRRLSHQLVRLRQEPTVEKDQILVVIQAGKGPLNEILSVALDSAEYSSWGSPEFRGRLVVGSKCDPLLTAGTIVSFSQHELMGWTVKGSPSAREEARKWMVAHPEESLPAEYRIHPRNFKVSP